MGQDCADKKGGPAIENGGLLEAGTTLTEDLMTYELATFWVALRTRRTWLARSRTE